MVFAADRARLAFVLNVVLGPDKRIVRAFAGAHRAAHEAGCRFLADACRVRVPEADVVVTSNGGHPLDQNVYQAVKGMTAGEAACREGGAIVLCAACGDGHGGEGFFRMLSEAESPDALLRRIEAVPRDRTEPDQWQVQILARVMRRRRVIVVTRDCDHAMLRSMGLGAASTLEDGIAQACAAAGPGARIAAIPDGVSVVVEPNTLFSGTILDNLRWGNPDATLDQCKRACEAACADEFIDRFPDGYETRIDAGGTNVSGGQRQRLCIARALLKRPAVLILDDSTSAVDTATDASIQRAFATEIPDTTKLIISQRVSSFASCDRILVLDGGRVNAFGTEGELLESCAIYRDVYEAQNKRGSDADFDQLEGIGSDPLSQRFDPAFAHELKAATSTSEGR